MYTVDQWVENNVGEKVVSKKELACVYMVQNGCARDPYGKSTNDVLTIPKRNTLQPNNTSPRPF
jgi:hypothetical protein